METKFSIRLRQLRLEKGTTQKQICDYLGLTRNALGNYEAGIREPSIDVIIRLCDYFDVSADYLIGRLDEY